MLNLGLGALGLILLALAILMFLVAIPRHGEVAGFLRARENAQAFYALAIICSGFVGSALIVRYFMS